MEGLKSIIYFYGTGISALILSLTLIWASFKTARFFLKQMILSVAAVFVAVFLYESWGFFFKPHYSRSVKYSGTFFGNEWITGSKKNYGFGPREDTTLQCSAQCQWQDTLVYDVIYTITKGQRDVPGNNIRAKRKAYFLGCSFVFGDGLNDSCTLPAYFNFITRRQFNVQNMAFSGYGPHQALKLVEEKIVKNALPSDSSVAVYYFIYEHLLRAAGKMPWDVYGPHYEIENDSLVYKGPFHSEQDFETSYFGKRIASVWQHSMLYRGFFGPQETKTDADRVAAIVVRMNHLLRTRGVKLLVIVPEKENGQKYYDAFCQSLRKNGLDLFYIASCDNIRNKMPQQLFIKGDGHPTALFNEALAECLAQHITGN